MTKTFIFQKIFAFSPLNYTIICVLGMLLGFEIGKNIYAILIIPAILLLLLPLWNMKYSIYSLVFLIPLEEAVSMQGSMQRITLIRIWGIYVAGLYIARNIIENGSFGFKLSLVHKIALILLPIAVLSSFLGIDQRSSIFRLITLVQLMVFSILIYSTVKDEGRLSLAKLFFIACGIVSMVQILDYFDIINFSLPNVSVKTEKRLQGFTGDPNRFGMTLLTALYFGMAVIVSDRRIFWKILTGIMIMFVISAIVLSVSRGAIINLAVTLLLFLIWQFYKKGPARFYTLVILFVILLALLFASTSHYNQIANTREYIKLRFQNIETGVSPKSEVSRVSTIRAAARATLRNPLGVGPGNFVAYSIQVHTISIATHNSIMQFAAELGIPGALCFLIMLFLLIKPILNKYVSYQCNIEKIIIFSFLAYFAQSLTLDVMYTKLLWFLIGLVAASGDYIRTVSKNNYTNNLRSNGEKNENESNYNSLSLS